MDAEFIIYLVFLAIFVISRLLKKPSAKAPSRKRPAPDQDPETSRPPVKSFEELLEEFTSGRSQEEPDDSFPEEYEEYEEVPVTSQEPETSSPWNEYKTEKLRTLDEMIDIEKVRTTTKLESKEEKQTESTADKIRSMLSDTEEARQAIILSEIIRRRY